MFVTAIKNTPIFNTREIEKVFAVPLPFDNVFLLRQLETIVYRDTSFEVVQVFDQVLQVKTTAYFTTYPLYIDRRFVKPCEEEPKQKPITLPSKKKLLERFLSFPKTPYIWGGNVPEGVPELLTYYPPTCPMTPFEWEYRQFKGVDCSGLIYHVTNGYTPRNTSDLFSFGVTVHTLQPLDLIMRKGHVLVVLPGEKVIESREKDGVIVSPLNKRLKELEQEFTLTFIRWY